MTMLYKVADGSVKGEHYGWSLFLFIPFSVAN